MYTAIETGGRPGDPIMHGAADIPTKNGTRFSPREAPPGHASLVEPRGQGTLATSETDVLRKRLQYAWDEIAHLSRAIKEAQSDAAYRLKQDHEELAALRAEVDPLREALAAKSRELDSQLEERKRLGFHIHRLLTGHAKTRAEFEQADSSLRNLRQMVARMQVRTNALTLELASKETECRHLRVEAERRTATQPREQDPLDQPSEATVPAVASPAIGPSGLLPAIPRSANDIALRASEPLPPELAGSTPATPAEPEPSPRPANPDAMDPSIRDQPSATEPAGPSQALYQNRGLLATPRSSIILWLLITVLGYFLWATPNPNSKAQRSALVPASSPTGEPALDMAAFEKTPPRMAPSSLPATPQHAQPALVRDRLLGGGLGPDLVRVGPGTFTMGSTSLTTAPSEVPTHEVHVDQFLISTTEVTFADYDRFARATGAPMPGDLGWGRGERPVIGVGWGDARAYAQWLSRQTGHRYRLPTEAEWEYAARGGTEWNYWWGIEKGTGNAVCFDCGSPWDNHMTAPVASLPANPYGLYDTAGNVMEWVADCWLPDYTDAPTDARARTAVDCQSRVARGGAFNRPAASMRSQARHRFAPNTRIDMLGFRVARDG